ncbi:MAG: UDP-N-acetylmuramoyl-L-alanyl-D-glutamate--2,6-diaminopimelate ligase [Pseudomonadota bacterium]
MSAAVIEPRPLAELLAGLTDASLNGEVTGVAADSRFASPGDLFLALARGGDERHAHATEARERGAVAVAWDPADGDAPIADALPVPGLRAAAGTIAARALGDPASALTVIGVTGTNGKSTCTWLLAQVLGSEEPGAGLIGTLGHGLWPELAPATHTTPDSVSLQQTLAGFRDAGAGAAVMEVSSHALAQERLAGAAVDIAVFTNISRDHLDYHADMEAYIAAKARLFARPELKVAVINADDPAAPRMSAAIPEGCRVIHYGAHATAEVALQGREPHYGGQQLAIATPAGSLRVDLPLPGAFNAANALAVVATLVALEWSPEAIAAALAGVAPPPGRLEAVPGGPPEVRVDYAHTPAALEAALEAIREQTRGRLWLVFGCGGDRDQGKRAPMGAVAEAGADAVVITDDNPRREDPAAIAADILAGFGHPEAVAVVHDRAAAIAHAISRAEVEDAILIAGKGHEAEQEVGATLRAFSDVDTARTALARRGGAHAPA